MLPLRGLHNNAYFVPRLLFSQAARHCHGLQVAPKYQTGLVLRDEPGIE
jgi:hypothetical protein